jgi:hypothetical protein
MSGILGGGIYTLTYEEQQHESAMEVVVPMLVN